MKFQVLVALFFVTSSLQAQFLTQFSDSKKKIGFVNQKGDTVFKAQFDWVDYSTFGYDYNPTCIVRNGMRFGLIDIHGKIVIPPKYDEIYKSTGSTDCFGIEENNLHGLIDPHSGKELFPPVSERRFYFLNGMAVFKQKNKFGLLRDESFQQVVKPMYDSLSFLHDLFLVKLGNKYGLLDQKGTIQLPIEYDLLKEQYYMNKLIGAKKGDKWGFVTLNGKAITSFRYDDVASFSDGLALFHLGDKVGYLNMSGDEVIPPIYEDGDWFYKGFAFVGKDIQGVWKYAVINQKGIPQTEFEFDFFENYFMDGFAIVKKGDMYGVIDPTGKILVPIQCKRDDIDDYFELRNVPCFRITMNGSMTLLDFKGKTLVPFSYEKIDYADFESLNVVSVYRNGKVGWFDVDKGKEIVPVQFDVIDPYLFESEEFLLVVRDGKKGIWSLETGMEMVPTNYDDVFPDEMNYSSNLLLFQIKSGEKYGLWNGKTNKMLVEPIYDRVYVMEQLVAEKEKYLVVYQGETWGLINQDGKEIIPMKYQDEPLIYEDKARKKLYVLVYSTEKQTFGLYDLTGKEVLPCIYEEINTINKGKVYVTFQGESKEIVLN